MGEDHRLIEPKTDHVSRSCPRTAGRQIRRGEQARCAECERKTATARRAYGCALLPAHAAARPRGLPYAGRGDWSLLCRNATNLEPPQPTRPILAVNNIEVVYDHVILVLKGVSLSVPSGGIVALLGANGAGKTTTLKAISNLLRAERGEVTKGTILFDGERVDSSPRTNWCGAAASR